MLLNKLKQHAQAGKSIRVGLVGAGSMGVGIAHQVQLTPGMELTWVADKNPSNAQQASEAGACDISGDNIDQLLQSHPIDVLVEATNSIKPALQYCEAAIRSGAHVVLMNAEVDLTFGIHLKTLAEQHKVVVTSDAGDQHGVLAKMIEEIELWGFRIVQAGNMKGFLNRHATVESLLGEAAKRNLNPVQCCAYTDGSKLNIEMALLSNAYGYLPTQIGMEGPRVTHAKDALEAFDLTKVGPTGSIDYVLGAQPDGGVYVIGHCDHPLQLPYLSYYKLGTDSPYYLFYRPYHLCHLETPHAIARAYFFHEAYLQPNAGYVADVYAFAKQEIPAGTTIEEAIGSDYIYGMVASVAEAEQNGWVPQCLLDSGAEFTSAITLDSAITHADISLLDANYVTLFYNQHGKPAPN